MVLRDSTGAVIFTAFWSLTNCNDALEAEISVVMEGLALAQQWSEDPIIIQTDCASVIASLRDPILNRSIYGHLYEEVKRLMNLREVVLVKAACIQNRVAHSLANFSRLGGGTACLVHHAPDCVSQLVLADCNSITEE